MRFEPPIRGSTVDGFQAGRRARGDGRTRSRPSPPASVDTRIRPIGLANRPPRARRAPDSASGRPGGLARALRASRRISSVRDGGEEQRIRCARSPPLRNPGEARVSGSSASACAGARPRPPEHRPHAARTPGRAASDRAWSPDEGGACRRSLRDSGAACPSRRHVVGIGTRGGSPRCHRAVELVPGAAPGIERPSTSSGSGNSYGSSSCSSRKPVRIVFERPSRSAAARDARGRRRGDEAIPARRMPRRRADAAPVDDERGRCPRHD